MGEGSENGNKNENMLWVCPPLPNPMKIGIKMEIKMEIKLEIKIEIKMEIKMEIIKKLIWFNRVDSLFYLVL